MANNKPASVLVSRWQKKPTKHIVKRRKLKPVLKKIINYMKSDTYMFAPFTLPQSVSSGQVSFAPMKKQEKKLVEEVIGYLKFDAYMYAPLALDSAYDATTTHTLGDQSRANVSDEMESRSEVRAGDDEHSLTSSRDVGHGTSMRRILVEHSQLLTEKVKHIVHQNCRSLSATGEVLSPKKPRKVVVE